MSSVKIIQSVKMLPNNADLFAKRSYQINNIKVFNDNLLEVEENARYQVKFNCGKNGFFLDIILGPSFPYEKPTIKISPPVSHEWVSEGIIVGAPGLINFNEYSELGRVIQAIISQFKKVNPTVVEVTEQPPATENPQPKPQNVVNHTSVNLDLNKMSLDELQLLFTNEQHFENYFNQLPATKEADEKLAKEIEKTEQLALKNMAMREPLEKLVEKVKSKKNQIETIKNRLDKMEAEYEAMRAPFHPNQIMHALESQAASTDQETEKIIKDFLNGGLDPDTFLKMFTEMRSKVFTQRARVELLNKSLKK